MRCKTTTHTSFFPQVDCQCLTTLPVEPTVARSDSLRGCWPVDMLCTTINVETAAR
jgi:hypothetical protein